LPALKLTQADLKPYDAHFWGVLPGQSSIPLGQITLPMQFGNPNHFRTDYVNTKFMAVSHYSYLVLKMPNEQGVLTLKGNVYTVYT
jgi:hypothetical protein